MQEQVPEQDVVTQTQAEMDAEQGVTDTVQPLTLEHGGTQTAGPMPRFSKPRNRPQMKTGNGFTGWRRTWG